MGHRLFNSNQFERSFGSHFGFLCLNIILLWLNKTIKYSCNKSCKLPKSSTPRALPLRFCPSQHCSRHKNQSLRLPKHLSSWRFLTHLNKNMSNSQIESFPQVWAKITNLWNRQLAMLGMVISPLIGIVIMGPYNPLLLGIQIFETTTWLPFGIYNSGTLMKSHDFFYATMEILVGAFQPMSRATTRKITYFGSGIPRISIVWHQCSQHP